MKTLRGVGILTRTMTTPISENERKGRPLIFRGRPLSANSPYPSSQRELEEHLNFCHHIPTGIQIFKGRGQVPFNQLKEWHDEDHESEFRSGVTHSHTEEKVIETEIETDWNW